MAEGENRTQTASRRIQGVIFDLDGVVVFTDRYHYLGWKRLADEQGWSFDETLNHQLRGVSRMQSLQIILDHNNLTLAEEEKERLASIKNEYYKGYLSRMSPDDVYPGSLEFVRKLRSAGAMTALASSSKNAQTVLDSLGIAELFDAVVTGHDLSRTKPDPQIFQLSAERLGLEPDRCIVFEDAESGVEAAQAAGMYDVGVGPAERLPGASQCIERYEEIDIDALLARGAVK
jgi:beta-phosphoglucomutase